MQYINPYKEAKDLIHQPVKGRMTRDNILNNAIFRLERYGLELSDTEGELVTEPVSRLAKGILKGDTKLGKDAYKVIGIFKYICEAKHNKIYKGRVKPMQITPKQFEVLTTF